MQKMGFVPPIFAVSARKALLARGGRTVNEDLWRESEFGALEEQISSIVSESSARTVKLRTADQTGRVILDEIVAELRESFEAILRDEARLTRVDLFLYSRKEQTLRQIAGLLRGVEKACRECVAEGTKLLQEKFSLWRTWRIIWQRSQWQRDFQMEIETRLRRTVEPEVEHAVQMLEADLRGLWPQLRDMIEVHLADELGTQMPKTPPDFARQRRELLQSIQLALVERASGKSVEEQLAKLFRETSMRLRVPAGVAAAGGIVALIAAMSSAAIADVTGILAASALVIGTVVAVAQRRKIIETYREQMSSKCSELLKTIEQQLTHAIELFYKEVSTAFQPLAAFCVTQRQTTEPLLRRAEELQKTFEKFAGRLG
jgi:hypothetical protein